ncbi:MAG TPA: hypothetical protein DCF68_18090 [Cyanothece sp. UBA12306]|nr:hypothetical protein [Cyanothece sp. UBA12306]
MNYLSRIFVGTSLILGTLLVASTEVKSVNLYNDYDEEALTEISTAEEVAKVGGFSSDAYQILRESPRRQVKSQKMADFVSPGEYAIFLGCDQECKGVKITVVDAAGNKLASDKGKRSAYVMVDEVATGGMPYKIQMQVKCNTGGKLSKVGLHERKVESCYSYSTIWEKQ